MSILVHVVLNGSLPGEPAAMQAHVQMLNSSPDIARAVVGVLRPASAGFEPVHFKAEPGHEDSRPELTAHGSHGRMRAPVERKVWAGPTDAQPVSCLADLPDDPPASPLFIIPRPGVATNRTKRRLRCSAAELEWEDASGGDQGLLLPRRPQGHADHELGSCPRRIAERCARRGTRHHPPRHTPTPGG